MAHGTLSRRRGVKAMDTWFEMEGGFLSNQRRGSDDEPTEYYIIGFDCTRQKRGIRRKRCVRTLIGKDSDDLDQQLLALTERPDVILIGNQPTEYVSYRGEPRRSDQTTASRST